MLAANPYLNFNGNTEEAFIFYKSVFGGEFLDLQRFKDTPNASQMPADVQEKIMHVALALGKSGNILMGTDAIESMGQVLTVGNNFSISLHTESKQETDTLFKKLSAGGKVELAPQEMFWGAYFAMCTDQFGIQWMLNCPHNPSK